MADQGNESTLRRDPVAGDQGRDERASSGTCARFGAGSDGAPLGGCAPAGAGAAVSGDRGANRRVDDDGDTGGALVATRRGRVPLGARSPDVLRIAVPVKGRLREPSFHLLEDAGLGPEQPGDRALAFPAATRRSRCCSCVPPTCRSTCRTGSSTAWITGIDLVRERGADVLEMLQLGFGSCRLEAAVPEGVDDPRAGRPAGAAVATELPASDCRDSFRST